MRDASSGRLRAFYEEQAQALRDEIEKANEIEAKPGGFLSSINPFD